MSKTIKGDFSFRSVFSDQMVKFMQERQAYGYSCESDYPALCRLDRFLCDFELETTELPKSVVDQWTVKRPNEKVNTQKLRIIRFRQFALFLRRQGLNTWIPDSSIVGKTKRDFTPYIFHRHQIKDILKSADELPPDKRAPARHLIMPEVFRLLYGSGLRVSEVIHLTVGDVDLAKGVLTVHGKFGKQRLVPLKAALQTRLKAFSDKMGKRKKQSEIFFPTRKGKSYSAVTIYSVFRQLLRECGIPHGGRGKGPRLHDVRHTFAVHNLENWYRQGLDLNAMLPVLATYMGHKSLIGTQWYLQLTPEIFSDINRRMEEFWGDMAQGGCDYEGN